MTVTCAEYQLFLDEQRTHGHNAAPDTWSDDTFPQGHARDSLRGARKEDAEAFCHWLTERDREGQSYRLPRREERQQLQGALGAGLPGDISYWEEDGSVVWSHGSPSRLLQEQVLKALIDRRDRDRDFALAHDLARARARDLDRDLTSVRASASASARDLAHNLTLYIANAFRIYIYIFLFMQRPNGMLPTYEGILLIKEHTKREER